MPPRRRLLPIASLLLGLSLLAGLLLAACSSEPTVPVDPYAPFRAAMRPESQALLDDLGPVPVYAMEITVDKELNKLNGTARIQIPNNSTEPWSNLVFRLYPMLEQYGGYLVMQGVTVNDRPATFIYTTENTALQIDLTTPLLPGEEVAVQLLWELTIPTWSDISSTYKLFGTSQNMTSLPLFYPSLAVYETGPVPGSGGWWLEMGSIRGDAAYNVTSLFVVTATLPAEQVPVTSGTLLTSTFVPTESIEYVWATGPSREFLLHMSPQFRSAADEAYGTRVTSYWLPEDEASGRAALKDALGALRIYSDRFGPYPYRDMRVAPAPISYRGMEYPQVSLLGVELYDRYRDNLEILVAHEVAHQWWYQLVHNDPVNLPWLDEALSEYSMKLYMEALRGEDDANWLLFQRWEIPVEGIQAEALDVTMNQPVDAFESGTQYETIVYGKGALFYDTIRERLGERRFNRFLQDYLQEYMFDIVTVDDWLATVEKLNDPELIQLFQRWVNGPQTVQPTPTATPAE